MGKLSEGYQKDSIWLYYYKSGELSYQELYNKGKVLTSECFDERGNRQNKCDSMTFPEFKGNLYEYLGKNIQYPNKYRSLNMPKLRVVVRFMISSEGEVENVELVQKSLDEFNEEAKRVVEKMPKWNPGTQFNRQVNVYYTLPISFALQ